jgi:hypothetical protein
MESLHTLHTYHTLPRSFLQVFNAIDATCGKFVLVFLDVCFVPDLLGDKQEIWAYSPIEWARWFAKNFATPRDIERTES